MEWVAMLCVHKTQWIGKCSMLLRFMQRITQVQTRLQTVNIVYNLWKFSLTHFSAPIIGKHYFWIKTNNWLMRTKLFNIGTRTLIAFNRWKSYRVFRRKRQNYFLPNDLFFHSLCGLYNYFKYSLLQWQDIYWLCKGKLFNLSALKLDPQEVF